MPVFWRLMDSTAGQEDATWLAAYRQQIVEPHRALFSLTRGGMDDTSLVRFRRAIVRSAAAYRAISDSLPARLAERWAAFVRAFPDAKAGAVLYVLPAPPNKIGGWVRPLEDHDAVVFGLDLLAAVRSEEQRGVLVNHELLHLYQAQVNPQMRDMMTTFFMNRGRHVTALHELMWIEAFATYGSLQLTPGSDEIDVMSPAASLANESARAQTAGAFRERLDVTDRATVEDFIYGNAGGLPPRAVSYIGLRVAEQMGKRYDLRAMARLQGAELRDAIRSALAEIE